MRALVVVVIAGACSFRANPGGGGGDGGAVDTPGDAFVPTCGTSDSALQLCLEFDDPNLPAATTALDSSGHNHDATTSHVQVATRAVPTTSQALLSSAQTQLRITKTSAFDAQQFTLSAWVRRDTTPQTLEGVIDVGLEYTMNVDHQGNVECAITSNGQTFGLVQTAATTTQGAWSSIACTYDGAQWCAYSFSAAGQAQNHCIGFNRTVDNRGQGIAVAGWFGIAPTAPFIGAIDSARIYSRVLSPVELCRAAGFTSC